MTETYAIYEQNSKTLWADSIAKETKYVKPTFRIMETSEQVPIVFQRVKCHMIFYVEIEDFRHKS